MRKGQALTAVKANSDRRDRNEMKDFLQRIHREGFTWRDSLFIHGLLTVVLMLIGSILGAIFSFLIPVIMAGQDPDLIESLIFYASFLMIWVAVILFCVIVKSNRPILSSFWRGLKGNTAPKYLLGLLIGFGLNAASIGGALLHHDIRIDWSHFTAGMIGPLILRADCVAIQCGAEEILCRGYYFQRLRKGYRNPAFAVLINPIVFTLWHCFNKGISAQALLNIFLIGVLMSEMVLYFDSFWSAIAFHSAWNFSQNCIFGLPNSGNILPYSIGKLDTATVRDSFFYNAAFGVENTWFSTLLFTAGIVVLFLFGRKFAKAPTDIWAEKGTAK